MQTKKPHVTFPLRVCYLLKGRGAPDVKNLEVDGHNGAALQQELAGGADTRLRA
jgi:hypothetical protein